MYINVAICYFVCKLFLHRRTDVIINRQKAGFGEKRVEETAECPEQGIMFARSWVN